MTDADAPRTRRGSRGGNGTGTLRWKEAGHRWELRMQVRGVRRSEYFSTAQYGSKQAALAAARKQQRILSGQAAQGLLVISREMSLDDLIERFISRQVHLEEPTRREYRGRLEHVRAAFGDAGVRRLENADQVSAVFAGMVSRGYSAKMIKHVRHVFGLLLDHAASEGYIRGNVIREHRLRTPTVAPREYRLFRATEIMAMLEHPSVKGTELECAIALMGQCALRPGEAFALRWEDVEGGALRIHRSGERETTKTKSGRRRIVMSDELAARLARWRATQGGPVTGAVFPGLQVKNFDRVFGLAQKRCGIEPPGRPYDLRHTAITHAMAYAQVTPGVSLADVARWAGHSRNSTTLDTYTHVLEGNSGMAEVMAEAYQRELARLADSNMSPPAAAPRNGVKLGSRSA